MKLVELIDQIIHKIPYLPKKLQLTWVDLLWKRVERLAEGW